MKKTAIKQTKITSRTRTAAIARTAPKPAIKIAVSRRTITDEMIAARAYTIWEQQGRPSGNEVQNWLLAEQQLQKEAQAFSA